MPPLNNQDDVWLSAVAIPTSISSDNITALTDSISGVEVVDTTRKYSEVLSLYRQKTALMGGVAFVLFSVFFLLLQRWQGFVIVAPVLLTLLSALGFVSLLENITVFHVFALLLVFGVSIDSAFFYREMGFNKGSWLAVTLSCWTSIFVFGFLSFSQVSVLHQFGITVFFGVAAAWLIMPVFFIDLREYHYAEH